MPNGVTKQSRHHSLPQALKLSPSSRASTSTGAIVNLYSTDARQVDQLIPLLTFFVLAPLQLVVCLMLLFREVHAAFVARSLVRSGRDSRVVAVVSGRWEMPPL